MPLINWKINLVLTWSENCVIANSKGAGTFTVTETKLYVPFVALSTQDNAKLLQEFKSGFQRTTNWIKCRSKVTTQAQNQYIDHLIDPSFQGVNRLFALSFEDYGDKTRHTVYFVSKVEMKNYNVMINGK